MTDEEFAALDYDTEAALEAILAKHGVVATKPLIEELEAFIDDIENTAVDAAAS